jgi:hypothetical protein
VSVAAGAVGLHNVCVTTKGSVETCSAFWLRPFLRIAVPQPDEQAPTCLVGPSLVRTVDRASTRLSVAPRDGARAAAGTAVALPELLSSNRRICDPTDRPLNHAALKAVHSAVQCRRRLWLGRGLRSTSRHTTPKSREGAPTCADMPQHPLQQHACSALLYYGPRPMDSCS